MVLAIPSKYKNDVTALRRIHYEITGRKNILAYMLENNMKEHSTYKVMWEEYLEYLSEYSRAKKDFTINCVNELMHEHNIPITDQIWNIDFENCELTISD